MCTKFEEGNVPESQIGSGWQKLTDSEVICTAWLYFRKVILAEQWKTHHQ